MCIRDRIWRASLEEVRAVQGVHPRLARHVRPPCTLRKDAGITPFCPEGPRYCGVPVWKLELEQFERLI